MIAWILISKAGANAPFIQSVLQRPPELPSDQTNSAMEKCPFIDFHFLNDFILSCFIK